MIEFRPLACSDIPALHDWLGRPHVSQWWHPAPTLLEVEADYLPMLAADSSTRGYIALLDEESLGFIQSYTVMGSGDGWWENETDPGARGIDQLIANPALLGQGLGSMMVSRFCERLFRNDPSVSSVQADPSPANLRAIRCYLGAGFVDCGEIVTPDGAALLMRRTR